MDSPQRCSELNNDECTADALRHLSEKYKRRREEKRNRETTVDPEKVFQDFMKKKLRRELDHAIRKGSYCILTYIPLNIERIVVDQLEKRGFVVDSKNGKAYIKWFPLEEEKPESDDYPKLIYQ